MSLPIGGGGARRGAELAAGRRARRGAHPHPRLLRAPRPRDSSVPLKLLGTASEASRSLPAGLHHRPLSDRRPPLHRRATCNLLGRFSEPSRNLLGDHLFTDVAGTVARLRAAGYVVGALTAARAWATLMNHQPKSRHHRRHHRRQRRRGARRAHRAALRLCDYRRRRGSPPP